MPIYCAFLLIILCTFALPAYAISFSFSDQDFLGGASWGTMTVDKVDNQTLQIRYQAEPDTIIPSESQVTGFAFNFGVTPVGVSNPADNLYQDDQDDLIWVPTTNLNAFPNPDNGDEFSPPVTKANFVFAATTADPPNNFNPPGILPGQSDVFYIDFSSGILANADLNEFISFTGIRLQSLPDSINGGSLALAGRLKVPEPSTLIFMILVFCGIFIGDRKRLTI